MLLMIEAHSSAIAAPDLAFAAVRDAFISAVAPGAASFPVVFGHDSDRICPCRRYHRQRNFNHGTSPSTMAGTVVRFGEF